MRMIYARYAPLAALAVLLGGACVSKPPLQDNATVMEIVQKAQEATDRDRYRLAIYYYSAVLERFPYDLGAVCMAEYEIAFIHYKQKRYFTAKQEFESLLERYEERDAELLPQEFRTLSLIVLKKIDDLANTPSFKRDSNALISAERP